VAVNNVQIVSNGVEGSDCMSTAHIQHIICIMLTAYCIGHRSAYCAL
jgi:hypothetical protein